MVLTNIEKKLPRNPTKVNTINSANIVSHIATGFELKMISAAKS